MQSPKNFNIEYLKKLPLKLVVLLAVFGVSLFFFGLIINEVLWEKEEVVDNAIFNFLSLNVVNGRVTGFMKAVSYFASTTFMQIAYALLVMVFLLRKNFNRALEIAAIGIGGFLVNYFMKLSFHRIRPPYPLIAPINNFSFPSGHATSAFIFYGLLSYLIWKTKIPKQYKFISSIILVGFSLLIGFSRVYLRVHYPSDVAAGFCIGFAWLILSIWLFELLKKKLYTEMNSQAPGNK
jgi:undecaprenyl-diphosphatase